MCKRLVILIFAFLLACLALAAVYNLPPIHEQLAWRVQNLRTQVQRIIRPPEQVVFVPQEQPTQTILAVQPSETSSPTPTLAPSHTPTQSGPTDTLEPTPTATPSPTPIPKRVILSGIKHEYQKFNNCGPANLSMALSYWDWKGTQLDTRQYLRPNYQQDDKNVNPYEMVDYVNTQTAFRALIRVGGDIDLLKRLLAGGFPVIAEKGFEVPKEDWMGHYALFSGYDDERGRFITQDSYVMSDFPLPYEKVEPRWRDFNYVYVVVYPPQREGQVLAILGLQSDVRYNYQYAAAKARQETDALQGRDLFFAWFNLGSSLAGGQDYTGAAQAYDRAFELYPTISEKERPWRLLWYQAGPFEAYYNVGRYQDVIDLANNTLTTLGEPILEEAFYWRGLAREKLGNLDGAISDLKKAVKLNPNFFLARQQLQRLGGE